MNHAAAGRSEYHFRLLTASDTDLLDQYFQALTMETKAIFSNRGFAREDAERLTGEDMQDPATRRYIASIFARNREIMVAYAFFRCWNKKIPWFGISVRDDYQGKGLGKRIMAFIIHEAREHGKGGILLTTARTNVRAQALYERCGFEVLGEELNEYKELVLMLNFAAD